MATPHNKHIATRIPCTRMYQIGALTLIISTFFITRLIDRPLPYTAVDDTWQVRGYGSRLSLKIYVYEENEIDGLDALLHGRDAKISADDCVKGQWGTQVKVHKLLLQSTFRTRKKEEADLFFVPTYVKCVRMMGGLTYKEINQIYVKAIRWTGSHLCPPKGDRTDKRNISTFNTWKDIIIPGNVDDGMTTQGSKLVQPLPLSKRKYLANFLGRAQDKVGRLQLVELAKQYPDKN